MPAAGLGQRAMSGQLAPFLADDFYYVVDKTSREPERLVLVGGQALEAWGVVLDVAPPPPVVSGGQHFHALTIDTDWLGQKADAQWLADLLGLNHTELCIPAVGDPTPNTAVLYLERNGRVHCLTSRMVNLKVYEAKRRGNGILQAKWALDILRAYLHYMVQSGAPEETMRKQCHRVAELAEYGSKAAEFCFTRYQIDPLQTIDADVVAAGGASFAEIDWPHTVDRIRHKQAKWLKKAALNAPKG